MKKDSLELLRELAKADYYQSLYSSAKELGLQIFENRTNLTRIQLWFISYMSMYSAINMDIAMGEISERVLENTVYEDAYMYYKKRSSGKEIKKKLNKVEDKKEEPAPKTSWVFKRAK